RIYNPKGRLQVLTEKLYYGSSPIFQAGYSIQRSRGSIGHSNDHPYHGCQSMCSLTASAQTMKKRVPSTLLTQIKAAVPADAEVMPLGFRYEDEDYNIAVFVDAGVDRVCLQDRLLLGINSISL